MFAEGRPLGPRGLYWLKVHCANLFGHNKISFDKREEFADNHIEDIIDSARNPLDGGRWWLEAEDPWQCLATCFEIENALSSGDPESYVCHLPVHQDGSCNGLQHYAALGRDYHGARAVNLVPSECPQDVYSDVLRIVQKKVEEDYQKGEPLAKALRGKLMRKIVKQTVMTSVYGVTFIGAREQILKQLIAKDDMEWDGDAEEREEAMRKASAYLAKLTLESITDLFSSARAIMKWLTTCARIIGREQEPVCWITPLGLPVVQPYRKEKNHRITTSMQTVSLLVSNDELPVSSTRQASAFPPNFVHSLDSTHMLKTALRCKQERLAFTAVHDSYWTHPCSVDRMNVLLREEFVGLHSQPLLESLYENFTSRFPGVDFPDIPERGELDLESVLHSPYFFN
jgi:DNA-directed RNA polymerase